MIPKKFLEEEQQVFKERVSQKNQDIMAAQRLAMLKL